MVGKHVLGRMGILIFFLFAFASVDLSIGQERDISCPPKTVAEIGHQMSALGLDYRSIVSAAQARGAENKIDYGCVGDGLLDYMVAEFTLFGGDGYINISAFMFPDNNIKQRVVASWFSDGICDIKLCKPEIVEFATDVKSMTVLVSFTKGH